MWVKVDDGFTEHPKVFAASAKLGGRHAYDRVVAMAIQGLCFAARSLTDGFLPMPVVKAFHDHRPTVVADALVAVGLWEVVDGGFKIHDYAVYNPTAAQVKEKRTWDAQRKELYRDSDLIEFIRRRDRNSCRYCGRNVNWNDRRSDAGGQFDHIVPRGPSTAENLVVACRGCNIRKGSRSPLQAKMPLLPLVLELEKNQNGTSSDTETSSTGTSESFASRARDPVPVPVPSVQKPEQSSTSTVAGAPGFPQPADNRPTHALLCRLAGEELAENPASTEADLVEGLKQRCARLKLDYQHDNGEGIRRALDSVQRAQERHA
jgi:hypothetical protein